MSDLTDTHEHVHGARLPGDVRRSLATLVSSLSPGARVRRVRRLRGGLWAHTHVLHLELPDGGATRWVLRRYVRWDPGSGPDPSCRRQLAVLPPLADAGAPVPHLLWGNPDGDVLDVPALLTTFVPGRSSLPLAGTARGVELLAGALAAVHAVPPPDLGGPAFADWARGRLPDLLPAWLEGCPMADDVASAVTAGMDAVDAPPVLRHGDFHAGNVLYAGRGASLRVTGLVDWDAASVGPAAADVSYCRADLAMALGLPVADAFAAAYRSASGALPDLAWWDLLTAASVWAEYRQWLPAYGVFGVAGLTEDLMGERLVAFVGDALERYSVPPRSTS